MTAQADDSYQYKPPVVNFEDINSAPSKAVDERTPLLSSDKGTLSSHSTSSLSERDVSTVEESLKQEKKTGCFTTWCDKRWRSIYIMYFTMFMSALTFSIVLSSIWPYLLQVDYTNATPLFLGWVVASYSFGQLVASPLLGFWADKRPMREPLFFALTLNVVFSLVYCYTGAIPAGISGYVLIVARALVGFGAGIAAVVRSYVSEATTEKERTGTMAILSSCQSLGFILGPALGLAFVPLKSTGVQIEVIRFHFNMYTGPGYLSALMGVLNIVLLIFFREAKLTNVRVKKMETVPVPDGLSVNNTSVLVEASQKPHRKSFDKVAAGVTVFMFFVVLFMFAVFETIATPFSMDEFTWTNQEAIFNNNLFFGGIAIIAITTAILVKFISKKINERVLLMVAMFLMAFGFFTLLPMGDTPPDIAIITQQASTAVNSSAQGLIDLRNASTHDPIAGCRDPPQAWCSYISRVYLVQYLLALGLLAVGYPAANILSYSIYSKILGPFPQGTMMGILTASGSLGRAVGPMLVTTLYQHFGPTVTFSFVVGIIAVAIVFLLVMARRLVPYRS